MPPGALNPESKPRVSGMLGFGYAEDVVLSKYIQAAMRQAHYELMENDEGYFGSIPPLQGVWAQGDALETCREELQSALEDWILFSLSCQDPIPEIDGIELTVRQVA